MILLWDCFCCPVKLLNNRHYKKSSTKFQFIDFQINKIHSVKLFFLHENFVHLNFTPVLNKKTVIVMRKVILLFSAIIAFALSALAENTTGVFMEIHQKSHEETNTKVNRSMVQSPTLDVVYDSDSKIIKITSFDSQTASVYIYDNNGTVVGYANNLNTTIQLLSVGSYTIYIEGESWYGIGYIN